MQVSSCWAESFQRNAMTQCPRCSLQQNREIILWLHNWKKKLKKHESSGSRWAASPALTFPTALPRCHSWRAHNSYGKKSFTLLPSHMHKVKKQWTSDLLRLHSFTAAWKRTAGASFTCWGARRWLKNRKSVSHLTIVPEYFKWPFNGSLQKVTSIKEKHQDGIVAQTYTDPSNSTVERLASTRNMTA